MKLRSSSFIAMTSTAVLMVAAKLAAQGAASGPGGYTVVSLSTLGGTSGAANTINDRNWAMGAADLAGNGSVHATMWLEGLTFDLGTLGGPNSGVEWPVKNSQGVVAGIAETGTPNPLGEHWSCSAFFPSVTGDVCLGFRWQNGVMSPLPTLGGYDGYAAGVNNHGVIAGWAETAVQDPTCVSPQVLQFEPAVWGANNTIHQLPVLTGDPDGAATAINDAGQVVGISGVCEVAVGAFSAHHAVLWQNGMPTDIGSLGGLAWNTPAAINSLGEVVGFSDLPGDKDGTPNFHAFLWTAQTGMQDLGTLPGDALSEALDINSQGQVVGTSCTAGFASCRAFIWQDGVMTDLNTLLPPDSTLDLLAAASINDRSEIAGQASDESTGGTPAFLATPASGATAIRGPAGSRATVPLPQNVRQRLLQRLGLISPPAISTRPH